MFRAQVNTDTQVNIFHNQHGVPPFIQANQITLESRIEILLTYHLQSPATRCLPD